MPSLRILLLVLLCTNCLPTLAESQRTLLYDYDEAGNLIAVRTTDVGGGPIIDTVTPLFLRRDVSTRFVVSGLNLSLVQISSASPEILISNINFISDTEVSFDLFTLSASLGSNNIVFSNLLGTASQDIIVAERLRIIATNPSPMVLTSGDTATVAVRLDEPFDSDKQFSVSVSDAAIASVFSTSTFTLAAGQTDFEITIEGFNVGNTQLSINQIDDSLTNDVAVTVVADVMLNQGEYLATARPVGVRLSRISGTEKLIFSKPITVFRRTLVRAGESIESAPVGVEVLTE